MDDWIHADLLAACIVAAASPVLVLLFGFDDTTVNLVLGLLFIFIAPGYAVVSILIPGSHLREVGINNSNPRPVSLVERLLLAGGLSIAIIPLIGVVLHFSPWMLSTEAYLLVTGILTFLLAVGAIARRGQLPRDRQFRVTGAIEAFSDWLTTAGSDRETYLNFLFVFGAIIVLVGIGAAVGTTGPGEQFTEFYVQTEDPVTGEHKTAEYPTNLTVGEQSEYIIGITNKEHKTEEYTVIIELVRIENDQIVQRSGLGRFTRTVAHGETVEQSVTIRPDMRGENLQLRYQLYRGTPPEQPSVKQAYRQVFITVDVSSAGDS